MAYAPPIAAPGPRTTRVGNEETEIKNPKKAAWLVFWAGELTILVLEGMLLLFREIAFVLLVLVIAAAASVLTRQLVRVRGDDGESEHLTPFGALAVFGVLCAILVPIALMGARSALAGLGTGVGFLWQFLAELWAALAIPWPGWVAIAVVWLIIAVRGKRAFKLATGLVLIGLMALAPFQLRWFRGWPLLAQAWQRLRWLLLPYFWPGLVAPVALALVMLKEMFLPALEHTMTPITWQELLDAGGHLWHLWFPRRQEEEEDEPLPEPRMRVEHVGQHQEEGSGPSLESFDIPLPRGGKEQLAQYAKAILHGTAALSEEGGKQSSGAMDYGYTQNQYRDWLKPVLCYHRYAQDRGKAGIEWTGKGKCWLVRMVYEHYGVQDVPEKYWPYLPASVRPSVRPGMVPELVTTDVQQSGGVVTAVRGNGGNGHDVKAN